MKISSASAISSSKFKYVLLSSLLVTFSRCTCQTKMSAANISGMSLKNVLTLRTEDIYVSPSFHVIGHVKESSRRSIPSNSSGRLHRVYINNSHSHILHRSKKMKKWNLYHRNRFKRTTTVEQDLVKGTPNSSSVYVVRESTPHSGSILLGTTSLPLYILEKKERIKRNSSSVAKRIKWPVKRVVSVEGDLVIGALMMVHSRGAGEKLCGPIMPQGGVQALEVMLYTLDEINKRPGMPFRIGAHILDDCDTDTYGLEMALDFIKSNLHYLDDSPNKSECSGVSKPIWGVVGAPSSITSIQVSNLLRLFKIPMISPFSTSPELSNKHKFDYFCRTIPSDYYQVQVIARIIDRLKWTYVSIIYEESNYGIKGLEELEKVLSVRKVCVAIKEKVLKDSGVPNESFYETVVARLLTKPFAVGVIVFASDQEVAGIMRAVKRLNISRRFSWIGSDGWSARNLVSEGNEDVVEGTISVQPQANPVRGFDKYFFNRKPEDLINPYFAEYWETAFECRLPDVPETPFNKDFRKPCDINLRLDVKTVELENQLQFVHQATCAFCHALINMHGDLCGAGYVGICEPMLRGRGALFLEYIKRVNFTDFSQDEFRFDSNGDGPAKYNIVHYKQTAPKVYKWVRVGRYENGVLNLTVEELQFKLDQPTMPESACSHDCEKGEVKKYIDGDKCCWRCVRCSKYQVVQPSDETECKECILGTKPDGERKACVDVSEFVHRSEFFHIAITSTTAFGFFNVLITFILYACNFNSAIVRASSREAQVLILIGAVFLHVNAYSFLLDPDEFVCSIQSYLSGLGYVLIYGTLFWKSYRIVRIFDLSSQYKNLNSPAFVLLVLGLCCIQKIVSVVWTYFADPREMMYVYPNRDSKIKLCSLFTAAEMGYFIGLIFPLTSMILCYFRTKKITNTPKIFDDSPQIFFCIRFTIVSWIAMAVFHFTSSDILFRQSMLSLITNMNGSIIVFALFYRSIFIILLRPQLNTREYLRASRANYTMKSQMAEDSHTRENFSQCMMNEFSAEDTETHVSRRDVSVQYSLSSDTNVDFNLEPTCGDSHNTATDQEENEQHDGESLSDDDSDVSDGTFCNEANRGMMCPETERVDNNRNTIKPIMEMDNGSHNKIPNGVEVCIQEFHGMAENRAATHDMETDGHLKDNSSKSSQKSTREDKSSQVVKFNYDGHKNSGINEEIIDANKGASSNVETIV